MEQKLLANRYQISRELARGGMGVVYEAVDRSTGRRVAVKVMLGGLVGEGDAAERFVREAQACARLDHPRVVPVLDAGRDRGNAYLVMGFLEGDTLQSRIRLEQHLQSRAAVEIAIDLAKVLEYVHGQGILHRDIKPENVILTAHGPVLTDFGIAFDGKSEQERLTQSGTMLGTPGFMPPEQVDGDKDKIDARADVYALGATLYAMLAGRPPFAGNSVVNLLRSVLLEDPPSLPSLVPVEPALDLIVQRCLAKEPEERYASARELREALEGYLASRGPKPKSSAPLVGAVLVLAVAVVSAAVLVTRGGAPKPLESPQASTTRRQAPSPTPTSSPELSEVRPTPQGPEAALTRLRAELLARNWPVLRRDLEGLCEAHPDSAAAWELRGDAALREHFYLGGPGRLREAAAHLDQALALDPDRVRALSLRAMVSLRQHEDTRSLTARAHRLGQGKEAHAHVARALQLLVERRATPTLRAQHLQGEVRELQLALRLDPKSWWAHTDLIGKLTGIQRFDLAERAVQEALTNLPADPYVLLRQGMNFKAQGEARRHQPSLQRAIELYDLALKAEPKFLGAVVERGYAHNLISLFSGGNATHYQQSVLDLETAIALDPTSSHAPFVLGIVHTGHRDSARALDAYRRSVAIDDRYEAWARIATILEERGDLVGARKAAARALANCPPQSPSRAAVLQLKQRIDQRH
jgi:serine/threonine protein kinase